MGSAFKTLQAINPQRSLKGYIRTSLSLLKEFSNQGLISQGSVFHGHLIKMGISSQKYVAVKLLIMYLNCKKCDEADQIVKDFNGFNLVVHNCLMSANIDRGNIDEACRLFDEMPDRNEVSWTAIISGLFKFGRVEESMWYFERNPFHDVISWTAAIGGLGQNGLNIEAVELFSKMLHSGVMPNDITFISVVRATAGLNSFALGMSILGFIIKLGYEHYVLVCNSLISFNLRLGEIELARIIFDQMEKRDVVSWTAILDMYVEMGDLGEARRIFDEMPVRNAVSWSAMIARYSQGGYAEEALKLFPQMVQDGFSPNISCLSSTISALANLEAFHAGRNMHGHAFKLGVQNNVYICSSLVDLYCRCGYPEAGRLVFDSIMEKNIVCWNVMVSGYSMNGKLEEGKKLFDQIPQKNKVSWNSMMAGYLENEQCDQVFEVFDEMLISGEIPDKSTFSSVIGASAGVASLARGKNLHGKIIKLGFQCDTFVGTALTDMYAKSGDIDSSMQVFYRIPKKNEISWTAMIQGLAENGFAEESLSLFEEMEQHSSAPPNELILLAVLFACSHCGLVDKGIWFFNSMEKIYGIKPMERHYTCVVDMLSRAGRLSEAEKFLTSMPCQPQVNAWAALLSGCKKYMDEQRAERTARKLWELSEKKSGGYVLLSNMYASSGRWLDVMNTRKLMKEKGLRKSGGCSWLEVKNKIHLFYSQDGSHSQSADIYEMLDLLNLDMAIL